MLQVAPVPAFEDNYLWLVDDGAGNAAVVDPGDAAAIERALAQRGSSLRAIFVTHHHPDHVGGVVELAQRWNAPVYGPDDPRVPARTRTVGARARVELDAPALALDVLEVPGHTSSHIAYAGAGLMFCGDTIFAMGCGRLFEGTPAQMIDSLDRIAALPPETRLYCTHEYTLANACFALEVEPGNAALRERYAHCLELRRARQPTLPSTVALERATNPFLRCDEPEVRASAERHAGRALHTRVERFAALRAWKDRFRPRAEMLA